MFMKDGKTFSVIKDIQVYLMIVQKQRECIYKLLEDIFKHKKCVNTSVIKEPS